MKCNYLPKRVTPHLRVWNRLEARLVLSTTRLKQQLFHTSTHPFILHFLCWLHTGTAMCASRDFNSSSAKRLKHPPQLREAHFTCGGRVIEAVKNTVDLLRLWLMMTVSDFQSILTPECLHFLSHRKHRSHKCVFMVITRSMFCWAGRYCCAAEPQSWCTLSQKLYRLRSASAPSDTFRQVDRGGQRPIHRLSD